MIRFHFSSEIVFSSKYCGTQKPGWGQTRIELGTRFGWNFFTRTRHWDRECKELLPTVTKFRFRTVEYYGEKQDKVWNFVTKKHDCYPVFEDKARKERGSDTRLILVIYRLPWFTLTNTYHTELDVQRHNEFVRELNKPIDET